MRGFVIRKCRLILKFHATETQVMYYIMKYKRENEQLICAVKWIGLRLVDFDGDHVTIAQKSTLALLAQDLALLGPVDGRRRCRRGVHLTLRMNGIRKPCRKLPKGPI